MDLQINTHKVFLKITKWMIIAMIIIIPIQIALFFFIPMPVDSLDFLILFHDNPLLGLLHMDLLYILNNTFLIFFYFALYITLNHKQKSMLNFALITGIVGTILYYASNRSVEMLLLSERYFSTSNETLKLSYLAIADSYIDLWSGTAFNIYYILNAISLILFSLVIMKSDFYTKTTGIIGLISGILMTIPSGFGIVGLTMSLLSLIPWIIFSILIAIRLHKINDIKEETSVIIHES